MTIWQNTGIGWPLFSIALCCHQKSDPHCYTSLMRLPIVEQYGGSVP